MAILSLEEVKVQFYKYKKKKNGIPRKTTAI